MAKKSQKQIAVAFSGSGFKISAHVGAYAALIDLGFSIQEVAGTSGGSIVSALIASGMNAPQLKDLVMATDFKQLMPYSLFSLFGGHISNSDNLYNWLKEKTNGITCGQTTIPFTAVSTNISNNTTFTFSSYTTPNIEIAQASRCSASIPFIYQAIQVNDAVLVDGGVRNDIPINKLESKFKKIGIELYSTPTPQTKFTILELAGRVLDSMLSSNENVRNLLADEYVADVIRVNTFGISMLDRNMSQADREKLYTSGYETVIQYFKNN